MIPMEAAVTSAFDSYRRLYGSEAAKDPLLEEIEKTKDDKYWEVTISFNTFEMAAPSALEEAIAKARGLTDVPDRKRLTRRYKLFRIDAETGELASMRMKDS